MVLITAFENRTVKHTKPVGSLAINKLIGSNFWICFCKSLFCYMYRLQSANKVQSVYLNIYITRTHFPCCALHLRRSVPRWILWEDEEIALYGSWWAWFCGKIELRIENILDFCWSDYKKEQGSVSF